MSDPILDLKEVEKAKLKEAEAAAVKTDTKPATWRPGFRLGLGLIVIGLITLALVLSGVNLWSYWWLLFFVKPLLFGFGNWGYWPGGGCRQATAANSGSKPSAR